VLRLSRTSLLWLAALTVSLVAYTATSSVEHFLWHLAYGAGAGVVAHGLLQRWHLRVGWSAAALVGYAFMIIPDAIWLAGWLVTGTPWPHRAWMDVFLLHVSLDAWGWRSWGAVPLMALLAWWAQGDKRGRAWAPGANETSTNRLREGQQERSTGNDARRNL
jgi:hypothetical protein